MLHVRRISMQAPWYVTRMHAYRECDKHDFLGTLHVQEVADPRGVEQRVGEVEQAERQQRCTHHVHGERQRHQHERS
jgi:hypothetical protein